MARGESGGEMKHTKAIKWMRWTMYVLLFVGAVLALVDGQWLAAWLMAMVAVGEVRHEQLERQIERVRTTTHVNLKVTDPAPILSMVAKLRLDDTGDERA